jgi:probable rRNA maturation factor
VQVADEQDVVAIDLACWERLATRVLAAEGVPGDVELSLVFVDAVAMARLNGTFTGANGPTDVLAFPLDEGWSAGPPGTADGPRGAPRPAGRAPTATGASRGAGPGQGVTTPGDVVPLPGAPGGPQRHPDPDTTGPNREPDGTGDFPVLLGDVVICPEVAATNAPGHAGTLDDELALLVVHGILHLLGMDHDGDADRRAMQARERSLLAEWWGPLARDPWQEAPPSGPPAGGVPG